MRNGDWIDLKVHRHESPVHNFPKIQIITTDDDLIAISKPASVPIYPNGTFRKNSLTYLLRLQHGLSDLFGVHRIDRQTSGLVLFARTTSTAKKIAEQIRDRQVEKTYVALVTRRFPEHDITCQEPLAFDPMSKRSKVCHEKGKSSETFFHRVWFDEKSEVSLVECQPKSGRTHQIRVHLAHLGFPIANDPKYGKVPVRPEDAISDQSPLPDIGQE